MGPARPSCASKPAATPEELAEVTALFNERSASRGHRARQDLLLLRRWPIVLRLSGFWSTQVVSRPFRNLDEDMPFGCQRWTFKTAANIGKGSQHSRYVHVAVQPSSNKALEQKTVAMKSVGTSPLT